MPKPTWITRPKMVLLRLSLWSPIKFKAPKSAGNDRIVASATLPELQARWQKSRTEWAEFFEHMPAELADKAVYRHPRVGLISWTQMMDFLTWHLLRHRKQMKRAVQSTHQE